MTIGCAGLSHPEHKLILTKSNITQRPQAKITVQVIIGKKGNTKQDQILSSEKKNGIQYKFENSSLCTKYKNGLVWQ
jgi:hypothetical protein